jgi:ferredoxin--NADP+ reductase
MTHVVTRACCNDAACVAVCPTNCIHPVPGDPSFATAEMLKIDPMNCIDCGACVEVCPVDAIVPDFKLAPDQLDYLRLNADYFVGQSHERAGFAERVPSAPVTGLRAAVVGTGPAAMYAVEHLLERTDATSEIHVYERLAVPWGLVRFGVAPDHQDTKQVARGFERLTRDPRVTLHLNVDVGRDITHEALTSHHHAVVYGVGTAASRPLGIPGEDLVGSLAATELVAWYNGHPDAASVTPDLSGRRVVVIGNGNVALDVARVLGAGDQALDRSDISDHALQALALSKVEEVLVLARRGPAEAAYTTPELLSLAHHPHLDVTVEGIDSLDGDRTQAKFDIVRRIQAGEFSRGKRARRRVVLRYLASPTALLGSTAVTGVVVENNRLVHDKGQVRAVGSGQREELECSLVVHAVGYRGAPIPGLPFDEATAQIPNAQGRVLDGPEVSVGSYVVGWAKRGPSGVIGTNKACAQQTVDLLLEDYQRGRLPEPLDLPEALARQLPAALGVEAWQRIDAHERAAGRASGRPRIKVEDRDEMLAIARGATR